MAYEEEAKNLAKGKPPKKKPADPPEDGADPVDAVDETEMSSLDDVEGSAADELASMVGVQDKAAFKGALGDYVRACVEKAMDKGE